MTSTFGVPVRTAAVLDLGVLRLRLATNLEQFGAYEYFARIEPAGTPHDYEVVCIDTDRDEVDLTAVAARADRSLRAKRFRAGYYLVHYFGEPAYLITTGRTFVVVGRGLERTVWPYFVKHILTIFSADHGYLHLKASALVQPGAGATLLVGRNGGGKTVFLTHACLGGAEFLTNTHSLIRDGRVHGVPTAVRVRDDSTFGPLIAERGLVRHMESGDHLARPELLFDRRAAGPAALRNVVIVDWNPNAPATFERIPARAAELYLDQFAFAVTTYGLKDDLFQHYGFDFDAFTAGLGEMRDHLRVVTESARCYRANVDMLDVDVRTSVLETLAT